ncbi:ATP-grasp domain-containing protein [Streptomyces sp. NPDC005562]|uniref:ATP-grasp domain-containing protein n=1 Tax=Streptomyces sp. NPDC005562 TaxID=3154890 RepID=UPI0033AEA064
MKVLAFGMHPGFAKFFENNPEYELYVIDEPDIYANRQEVFDSFPIREIRLAEYQQSNGFVPVIEQWHKEVGFDAVIACWEYAVRPAGEAASRLGLRSAGRKAIEACTDKLLLRRRAAEAGIPQPRYASASSESDLHDFYRGRPVIVKPTNRRASVGVVRADSPDEFREAWATSVQADELSGVASRPLSWPHLVEEYVEGVLVSVETLFVDGNPVFDNVTECDTPSGSRRFPITTITVPASISAEEYSLAIQSSHDLLSALDAEDGMFHSEWKINKDGAFLIESACRAPGIWIPELVSETYGFDLYGAFVRVHLGLSPDVVENPQLVGAVHYLNRPSGEVVSVSGVDSLSTHPAVFMYRIKETVGSRIVSPADSTKRGGYFGVRAKNHLELQRLISEVDESLAIVVDQ